MLMDVPSSKLSCALYVMCMEEGVNLVINDIPMSGENVSSHSICKQDVPKTQDIIKTRHGYSYKEPYQFNVDKLECNWLLRCM